MDFENLSAEECKTLAHFAEQCERFEDMVKATRHMIEKYEGKILSEERNLLSVAYKNVVGARRTAWRVFTSIELKSKDPQSQLAKDYKLNIIKPELTSLCEEVIDLLDRKIIDKDDYKDDVDSQVFFKKMKGDYYRYIAEISTDEESDEQTPEAKEIIEKASNAYGAAYDESKSLPAHSACRLGLALNYSVFHFEIKKEAKEACRLAKTAFDDAIKALDTVDDAESHKDSALILQLLRDNLTLWTADDNTEDDDAKDD